MAVLAVKSTSRSCGSDEQASCAGLQVVGAFLESGTPEENAAIKKVAAERPDAPSDLASLGLSFASKL